MCPGRNPSWTSPEIRGLIRICPTLQRNTARAGPSHRIGGLLELRRKAIVLQLAKQKLQGPALPTDGERARLADKSGEIHAWLWAQLEIALERFEPFLPIKEI